MYYHFFVHSSVYGYLGHIHVSAIVNSAAMNNGMHVSFSISVSSGYMPRSGIAGSYGGLIPSFLRNPHIIFHRGCISLHSHQQCRSVPFSPHPLQHLLLADFWIAAILETAGTSICKPTLVYCALLVISHNSLITPQYLLSLANEFG